MSSGKPSNSGLMSQEHEISRFENLFFKSVNTAYYFESWGLDWDMWLDSNLELPIASFLSYVSQESVRRGIVLTDIRGDIIDFTLQIGVTIENVEYSTSADMGSIL